jgi:hypothetical protein
VESRFLVQATALVVLMFFNSNSLGVSMPRPRVVSSAVVEDLDVLGDRVGQFDAGSPAALVEQLDLHP